MNICKKCLSVLIIFGLLGTYSFASEQDYNEARPKVQEMKQINPQLPTSAGEQRGNIGYILTRMFDANGKVSNWFNGALGTRSDGMILRWSGGDDGSFVNGSIRDSGTGVGIGTSPSGYSLDVAGDINFSGNLRLNGNVLDLAGKFQDGVGVGEIYYGSGNVGIGTNNPAYLFDVNGTLNATNLRGNGSQITSINGDNIIDGTVDSSEIQNESITSADILNNSVTTVDIANDTIGEGDISDSFVARNSELLDGYNSSQSTLGNTVAIRNSSGDINARLFRSSYATQSTPSSGADIAFRNNDSSDNYIRFTDRAGLRAYIGKVDDTDTLDSLDSTQFLRSDVNDTFLGRLSVGNTDTRSAGIYGIYNSSRIGHIWSMGIGYRIPDDGSTFGNLYGLAYKHTNNTTGGTMAGGHQMVWVQNGNPVSAIGSNIWTSGSIKVDDIDVVSNSAWVIGDRIQQGTVDGSEIQDNSLTANDLATNSVGVSELADNSVDSESIINGEVTSVDILDNSVSSTDISNNTITENDISDSFVARNSQLLDSLDSTAFIRSDALTDVNATTEWQDNREIRLGNGADMRMFHNGIDTYFRNYTGDFNLRNFSHGSQIIIQGENASGTNRNIFIGDPDNSVTLYYAGSEKLATSSTGINVTGTVTAGEPTASSHLTTKNYVDTLVTQGITWKAPVESGETLTGKWGTCNASKQSWTTYNKNDDIIYICDGLNWISIGSSASVPYATTTTAGKMQISGDLQGTWNSINLRDGVVDSAAVADNSLTASDLATDSVNSGEIVDGSVRTQEIANNTITETDISDSFVARNSLLLNGKVDNQTAVANTIVQRDSVADIHARLFRSSYATQTSTPASTADIAFRNSTTDNYIRFTDRTGLRAYIGKVDDADTLDGIDSSSFVRDTGDESIAGLKTFTNTLRAGINSATNGSTILEGRYTTNDVINTFGSQYSSAATTIGYSVRPKSGSSGYVSSAGNAAFAKGAIELTNQLIFRSAPNATVAIGSDVAMTERFRIDASGNLSISGTMNGDSITDNTIDGSEIQNESITGADIDDGTVASADITNNTITETDISDSFVARNSQLLDGINSTGFLRSDVDDTLNAQYIHNSSTNTNKFYFSRGGNTNESLGIGTDDTYTYFDRQNDETSSIIRFNLNATDTESGGGANANSSIIDFITDPSGGRINIDGNSVLTTISQINGDNIQDNTVDSSEIQNESITGSDILNGSIGSTDISDGGVESIDIRNNTITEADISDSFIARDSNLLDSLDSTAFIRSNANTIVTAHTEWQDNQEIRIGNGADLRLFHDGSNSHIRNYSGDFYTRSLSHGSRLIFQGEEASGTNRNLIVADPDNSINLYYAGANKLQTSSTGINVTGNVTSSDPTANNHLTTKSYVDNLVTQGVSWKAPVPAGSTPAGTYGTCDASKEGWATYNQSDDIIYICNASAWISIGSSASVPYATTTSAGKMQISGDLQGTWNNINLKNSVVDSNAIANNTITEADISDSFVARDSQLLDGIDSTQFLRSDTADTTTGKLTINNSAYDNHLRLQRSSEIWDITPSTDGSLNFLQPSGGAQNRLEVPGLDSIARITSAGSNVFLWGDSGDNIQDNTIDSSEIQNESITGSDILNGSIGSADISDGGVESIDIRNNTITEADISDSFVARSASKVNQGTAYTWIGDLNAAPRTMNSNQLSVGFVRNTTNNAPISYGMLLNIPSYTSGQDGGAGQILFPYDQGYTGNGNPMFRVGDYNNAGWASWKTFLDKDWGDSLYINVGESGDSIADDTIDSSEIQDNTLTSSDILNNTITETDISDSFVARNSQLLDGIDSSGFVQTTGTQTISGTKTFNNSILVGNGADILWENGVNRITHNDGGGNVQIRFGHDYSSSDERYTHGGTAFHIGGNQDNVNGTLQLKVANNGGAGNDQPVVWGNTLDIGSTNLTWGGNEVLTSASNINADTLDGVDSSAFLRSDVDDTFTGKLSVGNTNNRRAGMYGIYDSTRVGHIWSIGTAYQIPNDGSNFGNLYGLAYKHTNNPTGGTMAGGHQMVWNQNGIPYASLGTNIWTSGNYIVDNTTVIDSNAWIIGDRIQQNSIDSSEIQNETITGTDILNGSITGADISNDSLTASDLAPNSVGNSELIDNPSVTSLNVGSTTYGSYNGGSITSLVNGSTAGGLIQSQSFAHMVVGIRGNDSSDSFSIISGGGNYTTDNTYDTLVANFKANGNVGIGTNGPTERLDVNGNIRTSGNFIGNGSQITNINGDNITDNTIDSSEIQNGTITSADIADSTITGTDIANNSLTASDIAENSINPSELNNNQSFTMAGLTLQGGSSTLSFLDTTTAEHNILMHNNNSRLYFMNDVNRNGTWDESNANRIVMFGNDSEFRLGIGTNDPGAKLDVAGTAMVDYMRINQQNATGEGGEIRLDGSNGGSDWQIDNIGTSTNTTLRFHSGGTEFMKIYRNGDLQINGSARRIDNVTCIGNCF